MKPILPSLREKNRYIVYKVRSEEKLGFGEVKKALYDNCLKMIGQLGMGRANIMIMNDWKNNMGIIKINNQYLNELHASLLFIQGISGKKARVESVYMSGLLHKSREKIGNKIGNENRTVE